MPVGLIGLNLHFVQSTPPSRMTNTPIPHSTNDGSIEWRLNGKLHNAEGPAVITSDGTEEWWFENNLHRLSGPAVIYPDGSVEYWVNGVMYDEHNFLFITAFGYGVQNGKSHI